MFPSYPCLLQFLFCKVIILIHGEAIWAYQINLAVNHSKNFVDPIDGTHINSIEGTVFGLKQAIKPRTWKKTISPFLFEFIWRINN